MSFAGEWLAFWNNPKKASSAIQALSTSRTESGRREMRRPAPRKLFALWGLLMISLVALMFPVIFVAFDSNHAVWIRVLTVSSLYIYEGIAIGLLGSTPSARTGRATHLLIQAIAYIDVFPERWADWRFRAKTNRRLERVAQALASYPLTLGLRDPETLDQAKSWMKRPIDGLRELQEWVARPQETTRQSVLDRLLTSLECLWDDRWFEIPGPEVDRSARRTRSRVLGRGVILLGVSAVALAIGGILVVGLVHNTLGSAVSSSLVSVMGLVLIFGLTRLGISVGDAASISGAVAKTSDAGGGKHAA